MMRGFTLIEILVVLILLGILATVVVPTLPDGSLAARRQSAGAWQAQAEAGSRQANHEARLWGWQVERDTARLLVAQDDVWRLAESLPSTLPLAEGMALESIEIEGRLQPAGTVIRFGEMPPLFVVRLGDGQRHWQIVGLPSGMIQLEETR